MGKEGETKQQALRLALPPQPALQPLQPSRKSQHPPTDTMEATATAAGAAPSSPVDTESAPAPAADTATEPEN